MKELIPPPVNARPVVRRKRMPMIGGFRHDGRPFDPVIRQLQDEEQARNHEPSEKSENHDR